MCGIFAYLNHNTVKKRSEIVDILIQGLGRMEYRGYDSAGIAVDGPNGEMSLFRQSGKVDVLNKFVQETDALSNDTSYDIHCGIAHTRWATHGSPSDLNAHPQRSNADGDFLVVHNGIITNYKDIKSYLLRNGHAFESETDTEVIAKLMQHIFQRFPGYSFRELVEATVQQLEGAFALAFKSRNFPGQLVATRRGSPLLIGIKSELRVSASHFPISFSKESGWLWYNDAKKRAGSRSDTTVDFDHTLRSFADDDFAVELLNNASILEDDAIIGPVDGKNMKVEYFVASDASAIIEHTRQVIFLEDDDVAFVKGGALSIHRIRRDTDADGGGAGRWGCKREVQQLNLELQQIMRGDFRTFMQKEIYEQPDSVVNTMRGRVLADGRVVLGGIKNFIGDIKRCRRLIMIACGTSYNSANACRQIIEELTELPVILELASDFLDRQTPIFRDDVCICISQSGETADTLNALRYCKLNGSLIIGITNTVGSSICRESHCGIHINAGPEIGVASTKAYTSQILALLMFALSLSDDRISMRERRAQIIAEMGKLSDRIREVLTLDEQVQEISKKICQQQSILIMGRGYNFATCLEGALKIKELSYLHCEGVMSGELKHGPLAMVDDKLCILMIICNDHVYKKSLNALQQVLARSGRPIVIADETVPADDLPAQIEHVLRVPKTVDCLQNILTVIPFQLFSLHIAELNNRDVDRPRNLAKSVTVE